MVRTEYLSWENKRPKGINIPITMSQIKARDSMIEALLSNPPVPDSVLFQTIHQLCSSLLMVDLSNAPQLGFSFELALCIYSHRLSLNASQTCQLFAGMQGCFRLTLAHIIRLKNQGEKAYTHPPTNNQVLEGHYDADTVSDQVEWPDLGLDDDIEVPEDSAMETSTGQDDTDPNSILRLVSPPILFT